MKNTAIAFHLFNCIGRSVKQKRGSACTPRAGTWPPRETEHRLWLCTETQDEPRMEESMWETTAGFPGACSAPLGRESRERGWGGGGQCSGSALPLGENFIKGARAGFEPVKRTLHPTRDPATPGRGLHILKKLFILAEHVFGELPAVSGQPDLSAVILPAAVQD